ncbi:SusC/RagA family TonB-linked outer membrane protein [Pedobacter sp. AW31-3R]|uniref:SusC/RagA family TonB-linked outer membrane protein n=1 Tax=Pedobacter sp. AW31-3R TaxID=3445781 RepID=UPI003FA190CC
MYKKYLTWNFYVFSTTKNKLPQLALICLFGLFLAWNNQASAQSLSEKTVSIAFNQASLEEVIKSLEMQTKVKFVYNEALVRKQLLITQNFQGQSLRVILSWLESRYGINHEVIDERYIILKSKQQSSLTDSRPSKEKKLNLSGFVQRGTVNDEDGKPLPGVSIRLNNASNVAMSDSEGHFQIGISKDETMLIFSFIGYKTAARPAIRDQELSFQMQPDPARLDEVNVIGYGTSTRRTSTGSEHAISGKELMNTPASNPAAAIQGRIPGVYITQSNGLPGSAMTFRIRGTNSIAGRNNPLFIVDGVPYLAEAINAQTGTAIDGANGSTSPLNSLNPIDIESISVLKDADATAIYGSRGANGVVLITTKKGKAGKTIFDGMVKHGVSEVSHFVKTLSTQQYLEIRRRGYQNSGENPVTDQAYDLTQWDQNAQTDFQKLLIGNTAQMTDANIALSGGDERTNFRLSGTHHREGNVFIGNQGYNKSSANFNLGHKTLNQKFEVNFSAIYSADNNNISALDQTSAAYNLPPNYPLYNPDGSLYWSGVSFGIPTNPLGMLNEIQTNTTSTLVTNMALNYHVMEGLTFKTSLGFSRSDMDQKRLTPMSSMDPGISWNQSRSLFIYNLTNNYIIEPQLTYNRNISKGKLGVLLGGTWQSQNSRQPYYTMASNFPSDAFLEDLASAEDVSTSSTSSQYRYISVFGRVNYNWESKYILNLNFRRDGSSRFGLNSRFGNFGSAGAAWVFTEEKFAKGLKFLSFGKLRSSYGVIGSDQIGDYQYLDSYVSVPYNYNGLNGLQPRRIANQDYQWEQTKKFEAAIDLGFFDDKLSLSAAYYRNISGNQLVDYPLSIQAGFPSYQANMPAKVENKGWEFTLSSQQIRTKEFRWSTDFNLSLNQNKLLAFPNIQNTSYYTRYVVGRPLNSFYVLQYTGFDPATGLPTVADLNGNGTINYGYADTGRGDRYFAGGTQPKYYGGISNTLTYKNITLDFLFQFVKQKGRTILSQSFYPPGFMYNGAAAPLLDYINAGLPGQPQVTSTYDEAYTAYGDYNSSDAILTDASFIRLKNVNLAYDFSGNWLTRIKLQKLRLSVQAQNLFTITNYLGFDPESQGVSLPPLRTIVGAVQFTF